MYGIDLPLIQPWTSEPAVIDIVSHLFDLSAKSLDAAAASSSGVTPVPTSSHSLTSTQSLRNQLPELASTLFVCHAEWLAWLNSPLAASEPNNARAQTEFSERFDQVRPHVLDTLRRLGFIEHAFQLAEHYRDFRALAHLCHAERAQVYPLSANPHHARLIAYVEKFEDAFAEEVCAWCIEHGEVRTLFALEEEPEFDMYVDRFFERRRHPSVQWIHDIGKGRYGIAANLLLEEAEGATELSAKQVSLLLHYRELVC